MVKKSLLISFAAAFSLFTIGCGGGGDNTPADTNNTDQNQSQRDTTPPVITSASEYNVTEETNSTITLSATDKSPVTFTVSQTENFDLNGSKLTFSAPSYKSNGNNDYNISVTARDESNNTSSKVLTFYVNPVKAEVVVVSTGDKNLTVAGDVITGPTGLKWLNVDTGITPLTYDEAVSFCNGRGYRVARRDEILNLLDYTQGNGVDGNLLEEEFTEYQNKSESWALKTNNKFYYVNLVSGADDTEDNGDAQKSVLCVKGVSAPSHTFKAEDNSKTLDKTTGLIWTNIAFDHSKRRAINPDANTNPQQTAQEFCPNGYKLPDIAQLRSIVDYSTDKVNQNIAPEGVTIIWSATADTNNGGVEKNFVLDNNTSLIRTEETNLTYFVTCVKKQ